jgi:hypothetical protein
LNGFEFEFEGGLKCGGLGKSRKRLRRPFRWKMSRGILPRRVI